MADTDTAKQHTPPGSWPKGEKSGLPEHPKQPPPSYFDDKKKGVEKNADDVSQKGKKANDTEPETEWVEDNSVADPDDAQKAIKKDDAEVDGEEAQKTVNDAAKDGVEVTKEPEQLSEGETKDAVEQLQSGLKEGQKEGQEEQLDQDKLKEVEPEPLTEEEKKKLTPGGGLDLPADEDKVDDVAKEGEEATDQVKDAELPETEAELPKEGEEAVEGVKKEGEDAVEDAKDAEVPKEGEEAVEGVKDGELPKEGEEAVEGVKDGELPKEGEETVEGVKDGELPKEGEEAVEGVKDGELPKEGEEAVEGVKDGDVPKEGEEAVEGVKDDAEEAAKEGEEAVEEPVDLSILKGGKVNKGGNVVDDNMKVVGRIKDGVLANLVGKRVDENGVIWSDSGKVLGHAELIPEDEREALSQEPAPFEAFPDATVDGEGYVVFEGERVGKVVDGDLKRLRGLKVDADGEILDRAGNVVGKAERWEPEAEPEPEPEAPVDRSILAGKRVNKAGNVVDSHGSIFGRVVEGDAKRMVGRMCDKEGYVRSESGDILGRAEVVPEGERDGIKEGPFAELSGCTVTKDGKVVTPGGDIVGRLTKGDGKTLFGRLVDDDGDVVDANGNVLGHAERWEEPEVEKKKSPLAGRRVNKKGEVVDEDGNLIGKLTSGDLSICSGKEIDDDGDVVDGKGVTIGHVSLLEDIPEAEPAESAEDKEKRERAEQDKKLAQQMAYCLTQCLDKVKPICSMITSKIDKAERTPKEELDEEELVKEVRPLIEEGGKILQEANGIIRGLDPDGRIQANAKHNTAKREATPEEYHLADILKELTGTVTKTIEDAKKKLEGMPHAKKELSPLWGLLSEPLFQILAAVGLLLNGVLGLVGRLLSGLGLGGLVDSLLGGLGVKNILEALGIGSLTDSLTGKDKKKGGKKSGGLLGLGG